MGPRLHLRDVEQEIASASVILKSNADKSMLKIYCRTYKNDNIGIGIYPE
jgi:hypothetical protein